jgi:glycosyltransferase involved in cell wall biosynthesis
MKIWAYVNTWNEQDMLPYYLRHYSKFCDKIIVIDNDSSDNTIAIAKENPLVEIVSYKTNNTLDEYSNLEMKRRCVEDSKGKADYIIVGDCDEFIFNHDIKEFLEKNSQYSIIYPAGFQMVSQVFPTLNKQIYDEISLGVPEPWYSKPIIINPNKVENFGWVEGCHEISDNTNFTGDILHPVPCEIRPLDKILRFNKQSELINTFKHYPIKLLHFKFMGKEYVTDRYSKYSKRNSQVNKDNGLSQHYQTSIDNDSIQSQIDELISNSINVIK